MAGDLKQPRRSYLDYNATAPLRDEARAACLAAFELIGTFALVFSVVGLAVNPKAPAGWAAPGIGATLGMAVMAIAPLTGASLNPARALGPAISANSFWGGGKFILVYLLAPLVGGVLASVSYSVLANLRAETAAAS